MSIQLAKCKNCGSENQPTDKYCGKCGIPLYTPTPRLSHHAEAIMQKWEYMLVHWGYEKQEMHAYKVNEQELPNWKRGPNFFQYLNQLGEQGWEVIVPIASYSGNTGGLLLKRPKP